MNAMHCIKISIDSADWAGALPDARSIAAAAAETALASQTQAIELSLVLTGDDIVRALNRDYRGRDETTNVLSFAGDSPVPADRLSGARAPDHPILLGDVVVAFGTTQRQAEADERGPSLADHLSHLIIHGVLHLLGFDHQTDAAAAAMEGLETQLLSRLGINDPYRDLVAADAPDLDPGSGQKSGRKREERDERRPA